MDKMAVNWQIYDTRYVFSLDGNTDVIDRLYYIATDEDAQGNKGAVSGQQELDVSSITDFTPYDNVTEAQCLTWLFEAMGTEAKAEVEANVAAQIAEQANATEATGTPWDANPVN
jgi:hypothetical protein